MSNNRLRLWGYFIVKNDKTTEIEQKAFLYYCAHTNPNYKLDNMSHDVLETADSGQTELNNIMVNINDYDGIITSSVANLGNSILNMYNIGSILWSLHKNLITREVLLRPHDILSYQTFLMMVVFVDAQRMFKEQQRKELEWYYGENNHEN